jgi:diguanylate cyclase (GGDEF)-like protein
VVGAALVGCAVLVLFGLRSNAVERLLGWGVLILIALVAAVVAAVVVARWAGTAALALRQTIEELAGGKLDARSAIRGPSELRGLCRSVNRMADALEDRIVRVEEGRAVLEKRLNKRTRELEQANRLLMDIANRDALTGLANRRRLETELQQSIALSTRTGHPLAVIMMDLDRFKICNDTAGHLVGDNILRAVASTLRSRVRVTDLVVRWGGDEFCILIPATHPQGAVALAESLVDAVREATASVTLPDGLEPPTASAGVACFPADGEDARTLILNADAALYEVKATGRGRVLRYGPGMSED